MVAESTGPARTSAVFLLDFVDIPLPLRAVADRLQRGGGWLEPLAVDASEDGRTLLARLGPSGGGDWVARDVLIRVAPSIRSGQAIVVPLRWEAARHSGLFPVLDGDLEVAPLGPAECRLVFHASYRPPLDSVGRWLDRALLHRVAESTVRSFLGRVARALEASASPEHPAGSPAPEGPP